MMMEGRDQPHDVTIFPSVGAEGEVGTDPHGEWVRISLVDCYKTVCSG